MSYRMNAGDLRHEIYILKDESDGEPGADGNPVEDWQLVTADPIQAAKKGLRGRVFYEAMAAQAEDVILFVVRSNNVTRGITTDMRLCEGRNVTTETVGEGEEEETITTVTYDHTYEIVAPPVDPDDKRQWLEIRAREVLQNGG